MAFKSNDRTFEKVYGIFDKRDYFNAQGLAKVQIGNFERALKKNDKGAQQILDKFKGDMGKAKDYITQVITDRKKEDAFNQYKAFKVAVDSIQKGKPQYGAVDLVKSRIHNSSQKYTIALYSALRNKKFTKWKDVHDDVDSLIGESVNEYIEPQTKKIAYYTGTRPEAVKDFVSKHALNITKLLKYVEKGGLPQRMELVAALAGRDGNPKQKKIIKKFQESVNEGKAFVVMYKVKKDLPNRNVKPSSAAYSKEVDAKKFLKSIEKDGGKGMIVKSNVRGMKEGKKRYYQQDRVGSAKYTISYHDGKKKNKDGSDFFDIQTFKNKKDLAKFVNTLHKGGYVYGFNESEDGVPQGYNPTVENKKEVEQIAKKTKSETAFYDVLSKIEKKYGKRNYRIWLEKSLKDLGVNAKHYDYRTNAAAEEKLYQLTK